LTADQSIVFAGGFSSSALGVNEFQRTNAKWISEGASPLAAL